VLTEKHAREGPNDSDVNAKRLRPIYDKRIHSDCMEDGSREQNIADNSMWGLIVVIQSRLFKFNYQDMSVSLSDIFPDM
jgi:hypothetical protein